MTESNRPRATFTIHRASAAHSSKIRDLILRSGINPTALHWERFLVALTADGDFIGCGQVKPHADGTLELASLAVEPEWRGRGVARAIIEQLLTSCPGELYLMCQSHLGPMYEKFGFHVISKDEMPTYFRRVSKLAGVIVSLRKANEKLLVMHRPATNH
jgi:N-acetylglutamate synthase-like GNAT family acetyltransferase